jgi:hypothetical protein
VKVIEVVRAVIRSKGDFKQRTDEFVRLSASSAKRVGECVRAHPEKPFEIFATSAHLADKGGARESPKVWVGACMCAEFNTPPITLQDLVRGHERAPTWKLLPVIRAPYAFSRYEHDCLERVTVEYWERVDAKICERVVERDHDEPTWKS